MVSRWGQSNLEIKICLCCPGSNYQLSLDANITSGALAVMVSDQLRR